MIKRFYLKNYLSFDEINLEFDSGISVFSGVSGSGKSLIMNALLCVFGLKDSEAKVIECDVEYEFSLSPFGIENQTINNFRVFKDKNTRYFINSSMISKKNLALISSSHIKFLNTKDDELNSNQILNLLDNFIDDKKFILLLDEFRAKFDEFNKVKLDLKKISEDEKNILDLKEFLKFEIEKIENINPKEDEFEELMDLKKKISLKEKISSAWQKASGIFEYEKFVIDALSLSGVDTSEFSECMNNLREYSRIEDFEDVDIEKILNRIEELSYINKKYGSVQECLKILKDKKEQLNGYENIEFNKATLKKKFEELSLDLELLASEISDFRKKSAPLLEKKINSYLKELFLKEIKFKFNKKDFYFFGTDEIEIKLKDVDFKKLSSGEYQRLRLAFIATSLDIIKSDFKVLIVDEIDSNVSGKEAMSIAKILKQISKNYQIFAISHQPQLSSIAKNHFLVSKNLDISKVEKLDDDARILELARMISGDKITPKALEFAKHLRENVD